MKTAVEVSQRENDVLETFKSTCIDYLVRIVMDGAVERDYILREISRVEEERTIMPELVRMEMFADDVRRIATSSIPSSEEALKVLQMKIKRAQHALVSETDTTTTDGCSSTLNCSASGCSSDDEEPAADQLTIHLNPSLTITPDEYQCWLGLCQALRKTRLLMNGDAPRKLLLLMSSVFTSQIAIEAHDALHRLFQQFKDEWFTRRSFILLRRITKRALAVLGIRNGMYEKHSIRKMRLKQRRKVYKERKRVWDDERRGREGLEEEFGHGLADYRSAMSSAMPMQSGDATSDDPSWFTTLLMEHYASLEEQFARTILEREYADLTAQMAAHNPTPPSAETEVS